MGPRDLCPPAAGTPTAPRRAAEGLSTLSADDSAAHHYRMPSSPSETLTPAECYALVRSVRVGRVVFSDRALPGCSPVSFVLDGHTVVFRVDPDSRLAVATDHAVVAFEMDEIDADTGFGWTVLITGDAVPVTRFSEQLRSTRLGVVQPPDNERHYWVRLTPGIVTGQRVQTYVQPLHAADAADTNG
jgi:uncharacterized protein